MARTDLAPSSVLLFALRRLKLHKSIFRRKSSSNFLGDAGSSRVPVDVFSLPLPFRACWAVGRGYRPTDASFRATECRSAAKLGQPTALFRRQKTSYWVGRHAKSRPPLRRSRRRAVKPRRRIFVCRGMWTQCILRRGCGWAICLGLVSQFFWIEWSCNCGR